MGSNDIENWVREAHNSAASFFKDHVEQPVIFLPFVFGFLCRDWKFGAPLFIFFTIVFYFSWFLVFSYVWY